jgi:hypothetical protein
MGIIKNIAFLQPVKKFQKKLRILPVLGACIVLGAVFNTYHTQNMAAHLKGLHMAKGLVGAGKTAVSIPCWAKRKRWFDTIFGLMRL